MIPGSASLELTGYSQVDMLSLRYKPVNFGAEKSPGSPNRCARVNEAEACFGGAKQRWTRDPTVVHSASATTLNSGCRPIKVHQGGVVIYLSFKAPEFQKPLSFKNKTRNELLYESNFSPCPVSMKANLGRVVLGGVGNEVLDEVEDHAHYQVREHRLRPERELFY